MFVDAEVFGDRCRVSLGGISDRVSWNMSAPVNGIKAFILFSFFLFFLKFPQFNLLSDRR